MKRSYLKYFAGLLLFGSNGVVASFIPLTSYEIVLLRSVLGSAALLALFYLTGHRLRGLGQKRDLLFVALSGAARVAAGRTPASITMHSRATNRVRSFIFAFIIAFLHILYNLLLTDRLPGCRRTEHWNSAVLPMSILLAVRYGIPSFR